MIIHTIILLLSFLLLTLSEYIDPELIIPEAVTLPPALNSDCLCESDDESSFPLPRARIAYLVTVHNNRTIEDGKLLFRAIRSTSNLILVHVDQKFNWDVFTNSTFYSEIISCPCGSQVIVDSIHSSEWSSWSMNYPTFWGMREALKRKNDWDVFLNLSGDTFPVYHHSVIGNIFATDLKGINFVTSSSCETGLLPTNVYHFPDWWHKRKHYTTHPEGDVTLQYVDDNGKPKSITLEIYFGSQWVAIQPDFCEYIITSLAREKSLPSRFRDYLIKTQRLMTDETFLPTLIMHVAPFNETLPKVNEDGSLLGRSNLLALRYERMDEHVPSPFGYVPMYQHYDVPKSSVVVDQPKPWGPYYLGVYDLRTIKEHGSLFIRKVSQFVEPNLYKLLPVKSIHDVPDLSWPDEIAVSKKVDWKKRMEEMKQKMLTKEEEEEEL